MKELGEKCAVFGVYGKDLDASRVSFFGLFALQHRGQESSGIASSDGTQLYAHTGMGLVANVFTEEIMQQLHGTRAIGHNRYSTAKGSTPEHSQPIMVNNGAIAVAHNGNLPSTALLEQFLVSQGIACADFSDSRMIAEAIGVEVSAGNSIEIAIQKVFPLMTGSFSLVILTADKLVALRDGYGIRPLSLGTLNGGFIVSSETCAMQTVGATVVRDIRAGEMIIIDESGVQSIQIVPGVEKIDAFEFVYFARPDSVLQGRSVYEARRQFGAELARENPTLEADVVVPVPETALPVAIHFSQVTAIPMELGLIKNRYIHRTFIEPEQHTREQGVKLKLTALADVIKDKRVIIIDDSIVRGTTSKQIVRLVFEAGAKEVHFLVSSPPVAYPDFYGIDISRQGELLASTRSVEEMRVFLGATSLNFLSLEGMVRAIGLSRENICTSCFTGEYPIDLRERRAEVFFSSDHSSASPVSPDMLRI